MAIKHLSFLKAVCLYSVTAFGGPQGHIGMMVKTFVEGRGDITEDELLEFNSFCQMLPGPSSTQTVMLIAMKKGGIPLASLTLLLWILPATIIMGVFSFLLVYFGSRGVEKNLFSFVQPMSVGFVFFAAAKMMQHSVKYMATTCIMIGGFVVTIVLSRPWVFPLLLVVSGFISNFSNKRIPDTNERPIKINWNNLWLFVTLFVGAGVVSQLAKNNNWLYGRIFNIFENFYRFGSIVFGGGQVLLPMMFAQYSSGVNHYIDAGDLMTGFGMVQAVPGPVFSICSFVGGMAMKKMGPFWQLMGCATATIAVFLPSTLLLFFFFPIYQNLKHHVIIYRALEGINAVIVGIIWASGVVLFNHIPLPPNTSVWSHLVVVAITFCLLYFTKIPAPLIVIAWLLLGLTMNIA